MGPADMALSYLEFRLTAGEPQERAAALLCVVGLSVELPQHGGDLGRQGGQFRTEALERTLSTGALANNETQAAGRMGLPSQPLAPPRRRRFRWSSGGSSAFDGRPRSGAFPSGRPSA
jgi:hypothetical protein